MLTQDQFKDVIVFQAFQNQQVNQIAAQNADTANHNKAIADQQIAANEDLGRQLQSALGQLATANEQVASLQQQIPQTIDAETVALPGDDVPVVDAPQAADA